VKLRNHGLSFLLHLSPSNYPMVHFSKDKLGVKPSESVHHRSNLKDALKAAWELHYAGDDEPSRRPRFKRAPSPESPNPFEHNESDQEGTGDACVDKKPSNGPRLPGLLGRFIADADETKRLLTASSTPLQMEHSKSTSQQLKLPRGRTSVISSNAELGETQAERQRRSSSRVRSPKLDAPASKRSKRNMERFQTQNLRRSTRLANRKAKE